MGRLIAYCSLTGTTADLAQRLAQRLDAEVAPIAARRPRTGAAGVAVGAVKALLGRADAIEPAHRDPLRADLVLIGAPVWVGAVPPAALGFIDRYREDCRRVALFCTQAASGGGLALWRMERRLGRAPVATLCVTAGALKKGAAEADIARFCEALDGARAAQAA